MLYLKATQIRIAEITVEIGTGHSVLVSTLNKSKCGGCEGLTDDVRDIAETELPICILLKLTDIDSEKAGQE